MSEELVGFPINASKTEVMVINWSECLPESNVLKEYEKVDTFVYLGCILEADWWIPSRNTASNCFKKISCDQTMEYHM